tara:strand:+ start:14458 stop:14784 length:327 start_codon:yes stop_codon:yes gene_type:complete
MKLKKRNIEKEALKLKGGEFKSWYKKLNKEQVKEYRTFLHSSRDPKTPFLKRPWIKLVFSLSIILSALPSIYQDMTYGHDGTWTHYGMMAVGALYLVESILWIIDVWD